MSDLQVMEYDSLADLEHTIERVNSRVVRLDREMETVLEETRSFLESNYISDDLRSAAGYVDSHMPHKTMPTMVKMYASRQLEEPEQAENWDVLEEAEERASDMMDRYRIAYEKLWETACLEEEELAGELEGEQNLEHFIETWEEEPERLFRDIDSYENGNELVISGRHNPGLTMARFGDEAATEKQQDDLDRGRVLDRELREENVPRYRGNEDFWRERLYWKPGYSRWVDLEKMSADPQDLNRSDSNHRV